MEGGERRQKGADPRNVGSRKKEGRKKATWEDGRTHEKKLERQTRNERRREG